MDAKARSTASGRASIFCTHALVRRRFLVSFGLSAPYAGMPGLSVTPSDRRADAGKAVRAQATLGGDRRCGPAGGRGCRRFGPRRSLGVRPRSGLRL